MRDAVSLLDQMLSFGADTVTTEQVQQVLSAVKRPCSISSAPLRRVT